MLTRPIYTTLSNLIVLAEETVTRPQFDRFAFHQRVVDLASEVRSADARPAENDRVTQAAMVMIICLEQIRNLDIPFARPWVMLAGATLPLLREDAFTALEQERAMGRG